MSSHQQYGRHRSQRITTPERRLNILHSSDCTTPPLERIIQITARFEHGALVLRVFCDSCGRCKIIDSSPGDHLVTIQSS